MEAVDIVNLILQSVITVILIWYAIETHRLRKQTALQCRLSQQPIIDFCHDPEDPPGVLTLQNVGVGSALNLHVYMWLSEDSILYALSEFKRPSLIAPSQTFKTDPLDPVDSSKIKRNYPKLARLISDMPSIAGIGSLIAIYQDAAGDFYYSTQYADPSYGHPFHFGSL